MTTVTFALRYLNAQRMLHTPGSADPDYDDVLTVDLSAVEPTIREWYDPFAVTLSKAEANMERVKVPARDTGEPHGEGGSQPEPPGRHG